MLLTAGALPGVLLFAPAVNMLYMGVGPQLAALVAALLALLVGGLLPLMTRLSHRLVLPALPALAAIVFIGLGIGSARFNAEQPRPDNVFYVLDGSSGKAFWVSPDDELGNWAQPLFASVTSKRRLPEVFGKSHREFWVGTAPVLEAVHAPELEVTSDIATAGDRKLMLRVRSDRAAPHLVLRLEGVTVKQASIDGESIDAVGGDNWRLDAYAMGGEWMQVEIHVRPNTPFQVRLQDESYGLEGTGVRARPADEIPAEAGSGADTIRTVVFKKIA
jgi:hypothetical protein